MFQITEENLKWAKTTWGDKTINDIRKEAGVEPLKTGGDLGYVEWIRQAMLAPTKPDWTPSELH